MKVICIDESGSKPHIPSIKKGRIYHPIDTYHHDSWNLDYYILAECGSPYGYRVDLFIEVDETDIDETKFERNYIKEKTVSPL